MFEYIHFDALLFTIWCVNSFSINIRIYIELDAHIYSLHEKSSILMLVQILSISSHTHIHLYRIWEKKKKKHTTSSSLNIVWIKTADRPISIHLTHVSLETSLYLASWKTAVWNTGRRSVWNWIYIFTRLQKKSYPKDKYSHHLITRNILQLRKKPLLNAVI